MSRSRGLPSASASAVRPSVLGEVRKGHRPTTTVVAELVSPSAAVRGSAGVNALRQELLDEHVGLGPLSALVADPSTTDVLVNGDGSVWLDRGGGLVSAEVVITDPAHVRRLAVRLAALAGRRLDDSAPWVDGELGDGVRLHAVLAPVAAQGTHISLRCARRTAPTLAELAGLGAFGDDVLAVLHGVMSSRRSFLISGGTGTGKSTLLAAMLAAASSQDRIVIAEDVRELRVAHPHVVSLQGRQPNVEGVGAVTLVDLVRQALRMRPDRLVVGEVRGAEVRELLAALNTGHDGGCGTVHANAAEHVPSRLGALGALAGMSGDAVATQLATAVDVVIHLDRAGGRRQIRSIGVLRESVVESAVEVGADGILHHGPGFERLQQLLGGLS